MKARVGMRTVRLLCDSCGDTFLFDISAADIAAMPDFEESSAAALCIPCGEVMARRFANRARDPDSYVEFRNRCAESVARKLGLAPAAN